MYSDGVLYKNHRLTIENTCVCYRLRGQSVDLI